MKKAIIFSSVFFLAALAVGWAKLRRYDAQRRGKNGGTLKEDIEPDTYGGWFEETVS